MSKLKLKQKRPSTWKLLDAFQVLWLVPTIKLKIQLRSITACQPWLRIFNQLSTWNLTLTCRSSMKESHSWSMKLNITQWLMMKKLLLILDLPVLLRVPLMIKLNFGQNCMVILKNGIFSMLKLEKQLFQNSQILQITSTKKLMTASSPCKRWLTKLDTSKWPVINNQSSMIK